MIKKITKFDKIFADSMTHRGYTGNREETTMTSTVHALRYAGPLESSGAFVLWLKEWENKDKRTADPSFVLRPKTSIPAARSTFSMLSIRGAMNPKRKNMVPRCV